jgi:hypothetical protein
VVFIHPEDTIRLTAGGFQEFGDFFGIHMHRDRSGEGGFHERSPFPTPPWEGCFLSLYHSKASDSRGFGFMTEAGLERTRSFQWKKWLV